MKTTAFSALVDTSVSEPLLVSKTPLAMQTLLGVPLFEWVQRACKEAGALYVETVDGTDAVQTFLNTHSERVVLFPANVPLITVNEIRFFADCSDEHLSCLTREDDTFFVYDRDTLSQAEEQLRMRMIRKHQKNGVTIRVPDTVTIGPDAVIGQDTVIEGGCTILGNTVIGQSCTVGAHSELLDMTVGDRVRIRQSVLESSTIGSDTTVGPFAYIRPNSRIGEKTRIGDFVEIKNATIGNGTKVSHLTYVGDSDVGEGVNFGCGTVTANYDGKQKHRTTIKDGAFIGCNTNLIAPITVGEGAMTAAGSTITESVPDGAMAIARERQTNNLKRSPFRTVLNNKQEEEK